MYRPPGRKGTKRRGATEVLRVGYLKEMTWGYLKYKRVPIKGNF